MEKVRTVCLLVIISFLLVLPAVVLAADSPLDVLLRPLQQVDLGRVADAYLTHIFLFACIFISVAKLTIGKRFGGRPGNALSVVIGLVLALSLTLSEVKWGFSIIKSLGGVAASILVLVVALLLFTFVKSVGAGSVASGSFAFVITYFLLRAAFPELFSTLEENPWFGLINLGLVVAVIISVWKIISSLWSHNSLRSIGKSLDLSHEHNPDVRQVVEAERQEEKQEYRSIKKDLRRGTKKGLKESKNIRGELYQMINIIDKHGTSGQARTLIGERLHSITSRENVVLNKLTYLQNLSRRIENVDLQLFKDLQARWNKVPEKERALLKEELVIEKDKILSEAKLQELEIALTKFDNDFRSCVRAAIDCVNANKPVEAKDWLGKAIKAEEQTTKIFGEMKGLEDRLLKLTKLEFKTLRKERDMSI